jgi:hypothetical protein
VKAINGSDKNNSQKPARQTINFVSSGDDFRVSDRVTKPVAKTINKPANKNTIPGIKAIFITVVFSLL